jgi:glycosyltransferase involved in cell wall biosynthesis
VLRKSSATPLGLLVLGGRALAAGTRIRALLRRQRPDVVYVNTSTLPWWVVTARIMGYPVLCHVHEAEVSQPRYVQTLLALPLLAAHVVVANSRTTGMAVSSAVARLAGRVVVVVNGVMGPATPIENRQPSARLRLAVVGRLSPRKATLVALEATAVLAARGADPHLDVCGSVFEGYEWYEEQLRERASRPDLSGRVTFHGYTSPIWAVLKDVDVLLAPSLGESLGNSVVEAQLAGRPVVASAVPGHEETIEHDRTGLLVAPSDPEEIADAVLGLLADPDRLAGITARGRASAIERFGMDEYERALVATLDDLLARRGSTSARGHATLLTEAGGAS